MKPPSNKRKNNVALFSEYGGVYYKGHTNELNWEDKEAKMAEIIQKTKYPEKVTKILFEAIDLEAKRLQYSLTLAKNRLTSFEKKYNVSSNKFITEWSAEDLDGQDMEYIEWAGEYQLASRLNECLLALKSIENVT